MSNNNQRIDRLPRGREEVEALYDNLGLDQGRETRGCDSVARDAAKNIRQPDGGLYAAIQALKGVFPPGSNILLLEGRDGRRYASAVLPSEPRRD